MELANKKEGDEYEKEINGLRRRPQLRWEERRTTNANHTIF